VLSALPNGLLLITLLSNFGILVLYGLTNIICIVAFKEHHQFSGFKHVVVPIFARPHPAMAAFTRLAGLAGMEAKTKLRGGERALDGQNESMTNKLATAAQAGSGLHRMGRNRQRMRAFGHGTELDIDHKTLRDRCGWLKGRDQIAAV
jgi:hypothetical protein